jgi:hypothetical protein
VRIERHRDSGMEAPDGLKTDEQQCAQGSAQENAKAKSQPEQAEGSGQAARQENRK